MLPAREAKPSAAVAAPGAAAAAAAAAAGGGPPGRPGSALGGSLGQLADMAVDAASITTHTSRTSSIYDASRSEQLSTAGSVASIAVQAELMLGLSYNPLTARLAVEVVKGTNYTGSANHKPGVHMNQ